MTAEVVGIFCRDCSLPLRTLSQVNGYCVPCAYHHANRDTDWWLKIAHKLIGIHGTPRQEQRT